LQHIQEVIRDTITPFWVSSVPLNYGEASAGTLKADEWRVLATIYFPLALVSLWGRMPTKHDGAIDTLSASVPPSPHEALDTTMKLVSAVYLLCKRTTSHSCAEKYCHYVAQWLCGIQKLYPSKYSHRTNNHVAFHIYDFLRLFGPVYLWWCFPFERLIGRLQRIPHNDKIGKFYRSDWFHRCLLTSSSILQARQKLPCYSLF
ncbi:uncharacterized protein BXZ73DRAFT_58155, partial [Epithele typhae]|uniref:uncharacterized protein n=1 Tax=Epithele typhae TaxID=378194 RepID=UPI002007EE37